MYLNKAFCQQQVTTFAQLAHHVTHDSPQFFSHSTPAQLKIFNNLLWGSRVWRSNESSQSYIARKTGYTREWVNKILKGFAQEGLIVKTYRHRRTSVYEVHPFFKEYHVRRKLQHLFPAIVAFSLALLTAPIRDLVATLTSSSKQRTEASFGSSSHHIKKILKNINNNFYNTRDARERRMFDAHEFRLYIQNLTQLPVTLWGAIKLSVFPEYILHQHAPSVRSCSKTIQSYNQYFSACYQSLKGKGLALDLQTLAERGAQAGVSSIDPVLEASFLSEKRPTPAERSVEHEEPERKRFAPTLAYSPEKAAHWLSLFPPPAWTADNTNQDDRRAKQYKEIV